jgi:hypothetical protein
MHRPADAPRPSIYYPYKVHAPAPAQALTDVQVLVVGAGPIGLVTALGLAQQGVRVAVLESELQVSEGSRAIVFTRRSMEILQQAGVAERVTAKGLPWRFGNSFYRGQRVFRMEAPHREDDRFFPMTNLQQQFVEEYLLDALAAFPTAQVRWGHKVLRLVDNVGDSADPGVTLEIDTPTGAYIQQAPWVVAADGARSVLRAACGLKLEGAAYEGRFVIADIRIGELVLELVGVAPRRRADGAAAAAAVAARADVRFGLTGFRAHTRLASSGARVVLALAAIEAVDGVQTAVVVGPEGQDPRVPYTDHYASVRVQFHWDRQGQRAQAYM